MGCKLRNLLPLRRSKINYPKKGAQAPPHFCFAFSTSSVTSGTLRTETATQQRKLKSPDSTLSHKHKKTLCERITSPFAVSQSSRVDYAGIFEKDDSAKKVTDRQATRTTQNPRQPTKKRLTKQHYSLLW